MTLKYTAQTETGYKYTSRTDRIDWTDAHVRMIKTASTVHMLS